jgi:hypothetical protein
MQIILEFDNCQDIVIDTLINPVVEDWLSKINVNTTWNCTNSCPSIILTNQEEKINLTKRLHDAITNFNKQFKELTKFPFESHDGIEFTNADLNTIHRYFTSAATIGNWDRSTNFIMVRGDHMFDLWGELLGEINTVIHLLQPYYSTNIKNKTYHLRNLKFFNSSKVEYTHNVGDWKYLDYMCEYDVFIETCFIGKTSFQAYLDDDLSHHWDVTPQDGSMYNAFYIDVNNLRNNIMKDLKFIKWLKDGHRYQGAWQFMPLGKITSGLINPNIDANSFKGLRLK